VYFILDDDISFVSSYIPSTNIRERTATGLHFDAMRGCLALKLTLFLYGPAGCQDFHENVPGIKKR
jgi:hypothetical protein